MQIAVLVDDLGGSFRVLVVSLHHVETLAAHFALHAHGTLLTRFRVEHFHIDKREVAAYRGTALLEGVVQTSLRHTRRRLGESIDAGNGHIHLL